jgi:hypothetical protein
VKAQTNKEASKKFEMQGSHNSGEIRVKFHRKNGQHMHMQTHKTGKNPDITWMM